MRSGDDMYVVCPGMVEAVGAQYTCTAGTGLACPWSGPLLVDPAALSEELAGSACPNAADPALAKLKPVAGLWKGRKLLGGTYKRITHAVQFCIH